MAWNDSLIFVLGALIGSFLNVCIVRIPREESILLPRSHCRHCNAPLPFYDLIPLLSYLRLKGRCRFCHKRISFEYFMVELLTAFLAVWTISTFGLRVQGASYFVFVCSLIVITFIDIHHRIIPDTISIGGTILGFLLSFYFLNITPVESLLGIVSGGGLLFLLAMIYFKITKREGMGGGDIKLAAMIGAFLGYQGVFLTLFLSSIIGSLWGLSLVVLNKKAFSETLPYGPFLALGALLTLFFQDTILYFLGYL